MSKKTEPKEPELPRCKKCGKIPLVCKCQEFEDLKK